MNEGPMVKWEVFSKCIDTTKLLSAEVSLLREKNRMLRFNYRLCLFLCFSFAIIVFLIDALQ